MALRWDLVAKILAVAPVLSFFPLPGCLGGLLKLIITMGAGPIMTLHCLLLLGYAGLAILKLVSDNKRLKTLIAMSSFGIFVIAISTVGILLSCSPNWIIPDTSTTTTGIMSSIIFAKNLWNTRGVSFAKWSGFPTMCRDLSEYKNTTTIYKENLPLVGPSSLDSSFLNTLTNILFSAGFDNNPQTSLKTIYFPLEDDNNNNSTNKPGLVIFIHGGGWWTGDPLAPPSPCHAQFVHAQGWAFALVEYRLGRNGWSGDVQVQDVKDAIQHIIQVHGHQKNEIDTSKIILMGSSAGANLALTCAYQLNNDKAHLHNHSKTTMIAGVVAVAPSTSVDIGTGPHSNRKWLGAWNEAAATRRYCQGVTDCNTRLSPLEQVSQYTPKTILLHGSHDEYYTRQHSRALAQRLAEYHIPHVYIEPKFMPHCLDLAENIIPFQMTRFAMKDLMESIS